MIRIESKAQRVCGCASGWVLLQCGDHRTCWNGAQSSVLPSDVELRSLSCCMCTPILSLGRSSDARQFSFVFPDYPEPSGMARCPLYNSTALQAWLTPVNPPRDNGPERYYDSDTWAPLLHCIRVGSEHSVRCSLGRNITPPWIRLCSWKQI